MRGPYLFAAFLPTILFVLPGCKPLVSHTNKAIDACTLITKEEIEAVQGSPITDASTSVRNDGAFRVSQCFYAATESSKSVSLALTQAKLEKPDKRSPKDFWEETFRRYEKAEAGEEEREGDKEKRESLREEKRKESEEEEEMRPPKKIESIGDEAFWSGNRVGGALYVLKNDVFIRISVGGPDNEAGKMDKSKALAQKALGRL